MELRISCHVEIWFFKIRIVKVKPETIGKRSLRLTIWILERSFLQASRVCEAWDDFLATRAWDMTGFTE